MTETLPHEQRGRVVARERLLRQRADGHHRRQRRPRRAAEHAGQICTFTNRFTHAGAIRITKRTLDGSGRRGSRSARPPTGGRVRAAGDDDRRASGCEAEGDRHDAIPLGHYTIQETTASVVGDDGLWRVVRVVCDGPEWSEAGRVVVPSRRRTPRSIATSSTSSCDSIRRDPRPVPPEPHACRRRPTEVPSGGAVLGESASDLAELRVTKSGAPRRVTLGERRHYRVVVRNRGPATARSVMIAEHARPARPRSSAPVPARAAAGPGRRATARSAACGRGSVRS